VLAGLLYMLVYGNVVTDLKKTWPLLVALLVLQAGLALFAIFLVKLTWRDLAWKLEYDWEWLKPFRLGIARLVEPLHKRDGYVFSNGFALLVCILLELALLWIWITAVKIVDRNFSFGDGQVFVAILVAFMFFSHFVDEPWISMRKRLYEVKHGADGPK
jgi:hypothetical protein